MQIECVNVNDNGGTKNEENDRPGTKNEENDRPGTENGTKLSGNEEAVFDCIKLNSEITTKAIFDDLGISLRTVQRCLTVLKENGLVAREGSKTSGKWVILENP